MTVWILLLVLSGNNGISSTTTEFFTEAACQEAGNKAIKEFTDFRWNVRYLCFEKK